MALKDITDTMLQLHHPGNKYDRETKLLTVAAFVSYGCLKKAAEITGVPYGTVSSWKSSSAWWPMVAHEIKLEQREEFCGKMRNVMHKAADEVLDRLEHGDIHVNQTGGIHRHPVKAKDAMMIYAIAQDKQLMLENQTQGEKDRESVMEMQQKLVNTLLDNMKKFNHGKIIEGELNGGDDHRLIGSEIPEA